jgi:hypothetical protein
MTKPLRACVDRVCHTAYQQRGIMVLRMVHAWDQIVGPVLSGCTYPYGMRFTVTDPPEGVLELAIIHSAYAPMCNLAVPMICERIAVYFGYRAISQVQIVHRPLPAPAPSCVTPHVPPSEAAQAVQTTCRTWVEQACQDDPESAAVLLRLAGHIQVA